MSTVYYEYMKTIYSFISLSSSIMLSFSKRRLKRNFLFSTAEYKASSRSRKSTSIKLSLVCMIFLRIGSFLMCDIHSSRFSNIFTILICTRPTHVKLTRKDRKSNLLNDSKFTCWVRLNTGMFLRANTVRIHDFNPINRV